MCAPVRVRVLPRDACVRAPRCCARATRHREDAPFQAGCPTDRNPGRPDSNPCAFPVEEINIWRKARERRRARRLTPARRRRPARTFAAHSRRRHGARSGVPRAHPARAGRSSSRERARARRRFPLFAFLPNVPRVASRARVAYPSRASTDTDAVARDDDLDVVLYDTTLRDGSQQVRARPAPRPRAIPPSQNPPPRRTLVRIVRPVIVRPEPSPLRSSTRRSPDPLRSRPRRLASPSPATISSPWRNTSSTSASATSRAAIRAATPRMSSSSRGGHPRASRRAPPRAASSSPRSA